MSRQQRAKPKYTVYVDDNYHFMDESARYCLGEFDVAETAINACKKIVDEFLHEHHKQGMKWQVLYQGYLGFGEDPFIITDDETCQFSAWEYAKRWCQANCGNDT